MPILLGAALEYQSLRSAEPNLLNDVPEALSRPVRWVHSSEVLDIAPLLSGGELLLSGGQALAGVTAERQADYVRDLAARESLHWPSRRVRPCPKCLRPCWRSPRLPDCQSSSSVR